jgi:hypothetical protein
MHLIFVGCAFRQVNESPITGRVQCETYLRETCFEKFAVNHFPSVSPAGHWLTISMLFTKGGFLPCPMEYQANDLIPEFLRGSCVANESHIDLLSIRLGVFG